MTDEKIIALFYRRDEQAIEACMTHYGSYCRAVASGILADSADVEEAVADTWLTAWNTIPPKNPTHLRLFLGRITRNISIDFFRRNHAAFRGGSVKTVALSELGEITGADSPEETLNMQALSEKISAFLQTEPRQRRIVFVRRYFYLEDIPEIANRFDLKETNVRMMLSRTRKRLRKYLIQEGYQL